MAPDAIATEARRVAPFTTNGRRHVLYVAPTRKGGFCWTFSEAFGGCLAKRPGPSTRPAPRGAVNQHLLGVTTSGSPMRMTPTGVQIGKRPPYTTRVGGDVLTAAAQTIRVEYEDGSSRPIRFVFVSAPIDAGFFLYSIPAGHTEPGKRVAAVAALDADGHVLARQPVTYETRPIRHFRLPPAPKGPPPVIPSPKLPPPTTPLQRGGAGGVTVVAGRNGVAVFDTSGATPATARLIAGRRVDYACFSFMRYHENAPAELGALRTTLPRVAIRSFGLPTPFDGCEIRGGYGHRWPDRNGSHGAVEIAFTARGRRFFADRAAARDLALFVRSRELHRIRKLAGVELERALTARYGGAVDRLPNARSPLPAGRVGYAATADGATFVENSTSGRRFFVTVAGGKIVRQNVKPLGFVF
jgi:hypothetical protein